MGIQRVIFDIGLIVLSHKVRVNFHITVGRAGSRCAGGCRTGNCRFCIAPFAAFQQTPQQQHHQQKGGYLVFAFFKHGVRHGGISQGAHQLRYRLHPLGGVQPHGAGQHLRKIGRHTRFQAVGVLHTVPYLALRGCHRHLARYQSVSDRRQSVHIGVPSREFRR